MTEGKPSPRRGSRWISALFEGPSWLLRVVCCFPQRYVHFCMGQWTHGTGQAPAVVRRRANPPLQVCIVDMTRLAARRPLRLHASRNSRTAWGIVRQRPATAGVGEVSGVCGGSTGMWSDRHDCSGGRCVHAVPLTYGVEAQQVDNVSTIIVFFTLEHFNIWYSL